MYRRFRAQFTCLFAALSLVALGSTSIALAAPEASEEPPEPYFAVPFQPAAMLADYMDLMTVPRPWRVLEGDRLVQRRAALRQRMRESMNLSPFPERPPLDPHYTEPLDHPWCTIQRVYYQIWPGVYTDGLLYMPKSFREQPAPGVLAPHGHWPEGEADPDVQRRCLTLAKWGYVVFSPRATHYEDLNIGVSHQTLINWGNIRALDFLASLPEVDPDRLASAGASGGGMQTQFLAALDDRLRAISIVGFTSHYAGITAPHYQHCGCNHWPGVIQFTDQPGMQLAMFPTPTQYITMDDWTRSFEWQEYPQIRHLYRANGLEGHTHLVYEPTEHRYNRSKREWTYWWIERWLRNVDAPHPPLEPEHIQIFEPEALHGLTRDLEQDRGFEAISDLYMQRDRYRSPIIESVPQWERYRNRMARTLEGLLGMQHAVPSWLEGPLPVRDSARTEGRLAIEEVLIPTEAGIRVPAIVMRPSDSNSPLPVVVKIGGTGKDDLLGETGSNSARALARAGHLVLLPDIRFTGALDLNTLPPHNAWSWRRSAILWGRPLAGMGATDIHGVIEYALSRSDAERGSITLVAKDHPDMAAAALFAAIIDTRVTAVDLDFGFLSYERRYRVPLPYRHHAPPTLPYLQVVPFILQHGDLYQWAVLLADRETVTLRNIHESAGTPAWAEGIFEVMNTPSAAILTGPGNAPDI